MKTKLIISQRESSNMRGKGIELMVKSKSAKNGQERVITTNDNSKHLEYFMNGSWRHSTRCKENTNKECFK